MTAQQIYDEAISNGCSPLLAEMLAHRKAPGANTDREFFRGQRQLCDQFTPIELENLVATARSHGYNPSPNDVYLGQLARFPGDPEGFVSPSGGRHQIQKTLEQRGWGCTGAVRTTLRDTEPLDTTPGLAPDIVENLVDQQVKENPDLAHKPRQALREEVIDKHGPK